MGSSYEGPLWVSQPPLPSVAAMEKIGRVPLFLSKERY
jgi:hypothetical protein